MVFVLDTNRIPLDPCHPARARELLRTQRAAVFKRTPFTIILKEREGGVTAPHELKLDPGSKTTGIAIVQGGTDRVVFAAELGHRGDRIRAALQSRAAVRRGRRARNTRYRQARFLNRRRAEGWLPPSLQHRVLTTMTWVNRLQRLIPVTGISIEDVRFDTQKMENPEISGVEYQQGTLMGDTIREYLLDKWGRRCVYCGATGCRLEVEHIIPKVRGGPNLVWNLTISCRPCNQRKGDQTAAEFGFPDLEAKGHRTYADAAAVNSTRNALVRALDSTGLPLTKGSGAETKYNRRRLGVSKSHWGDAACVGAKTPDRLDVSLVSSVLAIKAYGHGHRKVCITDKYGYPASYRSPYRRHYGFRTGDIVRARRGKWPQETTHVGRATVEASGAVKVATKSGVVYSSCGRLTLLVRADGYGYTLVRPGQEEAARVIAEAEDVADAAEVIADADMRRLPWGDQLQLFELEGAVVRRSPRVRPWKRAIVPIKNKGMNGKRTKQLRMAL